MGGCSIMHVMLLLWRQLQVVVVTCRLWNPFLISLCDVLALKQKLVQKVIYDMTLLLHLCNNSIIVY